MQRNYFHKTILGIAFLLGIFSCVEETDWTFQPQGNGALVVEAMITDEFKTQEIRLSLTYDNLNDKPLPASAATITVSDGQNNFPFVEDAAEAGKYTSEQPFAAQQNQLYKLEILWDGKTYRAENQMVEVLPFNEMTFDPFGETDSLTVGVVAPEYSQDEQAMYEIDIDWSHISNIDSSHAKLFFYTFSTVDVNQLFSSPKDTVVFPIGSIVIEKKHSLNDDFAAFYRAFAMETEWQGSIYDENSASLPTNISNNGVGFFGVSAVLSDTLIAE